MAICFRIAARRRLPFYWKQGEMQHAQAESRSRGEKKLTSSGNTHILHASHQVDCCRYLFLSSNLPGRHLKKGSKGANMIRRNRSPIWLHAFLHRNSAGCCASKQPLSPSVSARHSKLPPASIVTHEKISIGTGNASRLPISSI